MNVLAGPNVGYLQQCFRELCYYKSVLFYVVLDEDHGVDYTDTSKGDDRLRRKRQYG